MSHKSNIPIGFEAYIKTNYFGNHHSIRMIATHYGVDHSTVSRWMNDIGVKPYTKTEIAKFTWKNHPHPNEGKTGELSSMYGRHLSESTKNKIRLANTGPNNRHWSGGVKMHSDGYVLVYIPSFVLEHRVVMESYLHRYLNSDEIVHHLNGVKSDNRIENLALITRSMHAKIHNNLGRVNNHG